MFLFFCLLHQFFLPPYLFFTAIPDGVAKPTPFVDLHDILLAGACWRQGVDVYVPSACMHGGVFNYSPFFLRLLPFGVRDTSPGGVFMALGFFASLLLLPKGGGWLLGGVLSPAVWYGIEQGNFDLVIFIMTVVGVALLRRALWLAYPVFGLAAALKFYPLALFVTVLREPRRRFMLLAGLGAVAGLMFWVAYGEGVRAAVHVLPSGTPFRATFGRIDLARGLNWLHVLTARRVDALTGPVFASGEAVAQVFSWAMSACAMAASVVLAKRRNWRGDWFLLAGAAVTVFCFYVAQNVEYRAVFLLLTLPALARSTRWLRLGVMVLLWEAAIRFCLPESLRLGFWMVREALWWWVIIELGAVVLAFVTAELARLRSEGLLKIDAGEKIP